MAVVVLGEVMMICGAANKEGQFYAYCMTINEWASWSRGHTHS